MEYKKWIGVAVVVVVVLYIIQLAAPANIKTSLGLVS